MSEQWFFDPDNQGRSFHDGYGLLDEYGHPLGIFIETGGVFDDDKQRAKAVLIAAAPDLLSALEYIASLEPGSKEASHACEAITKALTGVYVIKGGNHEGNNLA